LFSLFLLFDTTKRMVIFIFNTAIACRYHFHDLRLAIHFSIFIYRCATFQSRLSVLSPLFSEAALRFSFAIFASSSFIAADARHAACFSPFRFSPLAASRCRCYSCPPLFRLFSLALFAAQSAFRFVYCRQMMPVWLRFSPPFDITFIDFRH